MIPETFPIVYLCSHDSKFGRFYLAASDKGLVRTALPFSDGDEFEKSLQDKFTIKFEKNHILNKACLELDEFFTYKRKNFSIPFDIQEGTDFQRAVWHQLENIPYGRTFSYKQIATLINNPKASQAVGQANKVNPLPLLIPCQRCIGSSGALVGYAGNNPENLKFKEKLLLFEKSKNGLLSLIGQ